MENEAHEYEYAGPKRAAPNSPDSLAFLVETGKLTPVQLEHQLSRTFSARADAYIPLLSTSPAPASMMHLAARHSSTFQKLDTITSSTSESDSGMDLLTSESFIESERARETSTFCKVCKRTHIRPGPRKTLPDRDTCGSYLPVWHPRTNENEPWAPFRGIFNLIYRCVQEEMAFESMDRRPLVDGPGGGTAFMYTPSFAAHKSALGHWVYYILKQWRIIDISLAGAIIHRFGDDKIMAIAYDPNLLGSEETEYAGSDLTYSPKNFAEDFQFPGDRAPSALDSSPVLADSIGETTRSRTMSELQLPDSVDPSPWTPEKSPAPRGRSPTGRFVNASSKAQKMTENIKPGSRYQKSMAASFVTSDPVDDYAREYLAMKKDELGFGDIDGGSQFGDGGRVKGKVVDRDALVSKNVNTGGNVGAGGMGHGIGQTGKSKVFGRRDVHGAGGPGVSIIAQMIKSRTVDNGGPVGGGLDHQGTSQPSSILDGHTDPTVRASSPIFFGSALSYLSIESPPLVPTKDSENDTK